MPIYIAMHKPYRKPSDALYLPIQVGVGESFTALRDNTGDNIAHKNASYCELTALYWLWKNTSDDIIGLVHYRRYFAAHKTRDKWGSIISYAEAEKLLQRADIILPRKRNYFIETNYSQYAHAHHEKDLIETRNIIAENASEYLPSFDAVMRRRTGHRFNMFITRREFFMRYCEWLFPILSELEARVDISDYDTYNRRVFGFIAERLLDVWLDRQALRIIELPVVNIEGENWPKKIYRFLKRKIKGREIYE